MRGIYSLRRLHGMRPLLAKIRNQDMASDERAGFLNKIKKVSRYREAAQFLYRTAKKFGLVRHMRVVPIMLQQSAFDEYSAAQAPADLSEMALRLRLNHKTFRVEQLCQVLGFTVSQMEDRFRKRTLESLAEAKIHAEIQLLFHCDQASSKLPPRIICSSKDACHLCNTFISMHGQMHTPRTHGRLYPGWRLPTSPWNGNMQQRFLQVLEEKIRDSVQAPSAGQKKVRHSYPNESTVSTHEASLNTSESVIWPAAATNCQLSGQTTNSPVSSPALSPSYLSAMPSSEPRTVQPNVAFIQTGDEEASGASIQHEPCLQTIFDENISLVNGEELLGRIHGKSSTMFIAGSLQVLVEPSTELCLPNRSNKAGTIRIKWLTLDDVKKLHDSSVVDVEVLQGNTLHTWDAAGCIHLAARGNVVKITQHGPIEDLK